MPSLTERGSGKLYWRSLDELADTPEFRALVEREFPYFSGALNESSSRRGFLKVMGASLALAGLTGCRWPKEPLAEYAKRQAGHTPGEPVRFATSMELGGVATGLLVTSYDGRPVKVEGNPSHPFSRGGSDSFTQASILELYDPDRSTSARKKSSAAATRETASPADTAAAIKALSASVKSSGGKGLSVLCESNSAPSLADSLARLTAAAKDCTIHSYSPVSFANELAGNAIAFGAPHRTQLNLADAAIIASFDCDFQLTHPAAIRLTRDYSRSRSASDGKMNRLYVIESSLSLTGSNADERFAERFADVSIRLAQLAAALVKQGLALPAQAQAANAKLTPLAEKAPAYVSELAADLLAQRGHGLIAVGARQPSEAHALAALLNVALENHGKTVTYAKTTDTKTGAASDLSALVERINAGQVETLVILGGNPVYDAPADLEFGKALAKVRTSVHLSLFDDETSQACTWHLPAAHWLEAWGDGRAWDGTVSIQQPLIAPLYDGMSAIELVARLAGEEISGYDIVRRVFREKFGKTGDADAAWRNALHEGVVPESAYEKGAPPLATTDWAAPLDALEKNRKSAEGFEVVFAQDHKVYDGRFANNGWLQELPDPITKLTWDNAALVSVSDAEKLGVRRDDLLEITVGGRKLTIPACVVPGQAKGSITLPLGYGREQAGVVAKGCGRNVNVVRTSAGFFAAQGATVRAIGESYRLATTQDHHAMTSDVGTHEMQKRVPELVREGTLGKFTADSKFAQKIGHKLPLVQLFASHEFPDKPKWAMAIDLSKCTGCSACVVACQAENNIPVVGKEEVQLGREMHWIRIDRYFLGDPHSDHIEVVHQPIPCQHCENAPCEQVCPVAATVHDEQGLNVMVYNRCIGTRYCSNNCPYKVRRFNWFNNNHGPRHPRSRASGKTVFQTLDIKNSPSMLPATKLTDIEKMGKNPDVTVRSRGVMEKCTFCVQRLTAAKIDARNDQLNPKFGDRGSGVISDASVVTACAQACPAEAITFGDLHNPSSAIRGAFEHDRSYTLLEEINVRPRVRYLAKLRNPAKDSGADEGHGHGHGEQAKPANKVEHS